PRSTTSAKSRERSRFRAAISRRTSKDKWRVTHRSSCTAPTEIARRLPRTSCRSWGTRTYGRSVKDSAVGWRRAATSSDAPEIVTLDALLAHPDIARLARTLRETRGKEISDETPTSWAAIAL